MITIRNEAVLTGSTRYPRFFPDAGQARVNRYGFFSGLSSILFSFFLMN